MPKDQKMRLDISRTEPLFGPPAKLYGPVVGGTVPRLCSTSYRFWNAENLVSGLHSGTITVAEINCVTVAEALNYAHLAATTSLVRSCRWFEASWREYESDNLLGWAACLRSLLEAIGDTIDGLGGVAITLADNMPELMRGLTGFDGGILDLGELEDQLIHFSHARKISRAERSSVPDSHVPRKTYEYIDILRSAGVPDTATLYAELCEIGHPASKSLSWMHEATDGGFRISPDQDRIAIEAIIKSHGADLHLLPSLAFNPGLLALRVLVKFGLFPPLPELRSFSFQDARQWDQIRALLANGPPSLTHSALLDGIIAATVTSVAPA